MPFLYWSKASEVPRVLSVGAPAVGGEGCPAGVGRLWRVPQKLHCLQGGDQEDRVRFCMLRENRYKRGSDWRNFFFMRAAEL